MDAQAKIESWSPNRTTEAGKRLLASLRETDWEIEAEEFFQRYSWRSPHRSHVYFIKGGSLVKIGYAKDVQARLKLLQCGSPILLTLIGSLPGGQPLEYALHKRFATCRKSGEWFRITKPVLRFVPKLLMLHDVTKVLKP